MVKFYLIVTVKNLELAADIQEAADEIEEKVGSPPAPAVDLKDKVEIIACVLDRNAAETRAREEAESHFPRPVFVLDPFVAFRAEPRPISRNVIY